VAVVEQAVEHGGDGGGVAEQSAPVLDGRGGSAGRAGRFVLSLQLFDFSLLLVDLLPQASDLLHELFQGHAFGTSGCCQRQGGCDCKGDRPQRAVSAAMGAEGTMRPAPMLIRSEQLAASACESASGSRCHVHLSCSSWSAVESLIARVASVMDARFGKSSRLAQLFVP
jgi:hypothetical protein